MWANWLGLVGSSAACIRARTSTLVADSSVFVSLLKTKKLVVMSFLNALIFGIAWADRAEGHAYG